MKHKVLIIAIALIGIILLTGFAFQQTGMIFKGPFPLIWYYNDIQNSYMQLDLQGSPEYVLGNIITISKDINSKSSINIRAIGPDLHEGGVYLRGDGDNSSALLTTGTASIMVYNNYVEAYPIMQADIIRAYTGFTVGDSAGYNGDVNVNGTILHVRGGIIVDVTSLQTDSFTK